MESKTLTEIIHKLSAKQQDYIVFCAQQYAGKPELHRGLLPFLPADVAVRCLNLKLENLKEGFPADPENDVRPVGEAFIRNIISILSQLTAGKLYSNEASAEICLSDRGLLKFYKKRFSHKFCAKLNPQIRSQLNSESLVGLERIRENYWKVTAKAEYIKYVTQTLSDIAASYQ